MFWIEQFEFWTFWLSPDESFISPPYPSEDDELSNIYIADGIVRRNDDGSYTTLVSQDWRFFLEAGSYDKSPVFKAARWSGYYDEIERALFHRNANGSREMIDQDRDLLNGPYDQVYPFGKYGCRPDEAFVRTGVFYGVIKKVGKWSSRQIIPPDYCLFFDPSLDFKKKEEVPIKFYPELFDGYRMAVAIGSAGEKYVLYEDDKNSFIKLNLSPKDLLDKYDEFRDFCDRAFECTKKS